MIDTTTYSYTDWCAQERYAPGEGLSDAARVRSMLSAITGELDRRAVRRRIGNDARNRRDAREQFMARMGAV